jgi:hypothetical protein
MTNNAAGGRVVPFFFATWRFGSNLILVSLWNNIWWKTIILKPYEGLLTKIYLNVQGIYQVHVIIMPP